MLALNLCTVNSTTRSCSVSRGNSELMGVVKAQGKDEPEEDPLDAFMAAEILPEVKAKQEAERLRKDEERRQKAALLAV